MMAAMLCLVVKMMAGGVTLALAQGPGSGPEEFEPDFVTLLKDAMSPALAGSAPGSNMAGSALNIITQLDMPLRSAVFDGDEKTARGEPRYVAQDFSSMAGTDFSQNFIDVRLPLMPQPRKGVENGIAYALIVDMAALDVVRYDLDGEGGEPKVTHSSHSALPPLGPEAGKVFEYAAGFVWGLAFTAGDLDRAGPIPLGFVYPFPVNQSRLNHGWLIDGTKETDLEGLVGKDPMSLLEAALEARAPGKKQEPFKVAALANDAVDLLSECAYKHKGDCSLGIVLGEGYNIAYYDSEKQMTINTEMGDFSGLRRSPIDKEIDNRSHSPGTQQLEKMTSSAYLGELLRVYSIELFGGRGVPGVPDTWSTPFSVDADYLLRCAYDLGPLGSDRALMVDLCRSILNRSARLAARTILAVAMRAGLSTRNIVAGIRGRLCERKEYRKYLVAAVERLTPPDAVGRLSFVVLPEGLGLGAAVMAKEFARYGWPLVDVTDHLRGQDIKNHFRCCCDPPIEGQELHTGRCIVVEAQGKKCKQQRVPWARALKHYSRMERNRCMVPEDETKNGTPRVIL